jgi:hypothetical protein
MKKLSISMVALLAILFAVGSAFAPKASLVREGWYKADGVKLIAAASDPASYETSAIPGYTSVEDATNVSEQVCDVIETRLCAAFFDASATPNENIVTFLDGGLLE